MNNVNYRKYESLDIGRVKFEVFSNSILYKELEDLFRLYGRIDGSKDITKIGLDSFDKVFDDALLILNGLYKKSREYYEYLNYDTSYDTNLFFEYNNSWQRIEDTRYRELYYLKKLILLGKSFHELYQNIDKNTESSLSKILVDYCSTIYTEKFNKIIDIDELFFKLDIYNWLIKMEIQNGEPVEIPKVLNHSAKIEQYFKNDRKKIIEIIIESVSVDSINNSNTNYLSMPNPLNNKYNNLIFEMNIIIEELESQ